MTVLGDKAKIEHIGSTDIPGLSAKPVLDIMIGISSEDLASNKYISLIESLGYQYIPAFEENMPNRRYFQKNNLEGLRTHQIHLVVYPSSWWERHILFRDYCRQHDKDAKAYEAHKYQLAAEHDDTVSYAIAKTAFCRQIDEKAYFNFEINQPHFITKRAKGFIPQLACLQPLQKMYQDATFINNFGVSLNDKQISDVLNYDMEHWNRLGYGILMWFDKQTNEFMGKSGLREIHLEEQKVVELAYGLLPEYWGKGLTAEISIEVIKDGFLQHHLDNIVCFTLENNQRSLRVIEKLGFQFEKNFIYEELPHKFYRLTKDCLKDFV